jgi:3-dehydroquinate synthase
MEFLVDQIKFAAEIDLSDSISIKSSRKIYDVLYSSKNLDTLINENYVTNDFIFIDRNVFNLSPQTFENINIQNIFVFDALETTKNIESVLNLTDLLYNNKFTKKNKLIVIGGGITQDVGGFAAAIYKRGINWFYIPTTILSMTDSCIGSKVSINRCSKNILGMFVAPDKIFISDYFLNSLSQDDISSGIGEALKLSLIGGKTMFDIFKCKFLIKDYMSIIKLASLIKKQIIEYDEFELSTRKVLNYGHTIGHAIESTTSYFIPHGIAVLMGMYIKNKLFYGDKYDDVNAIILQIIDSKFFNIEFNYSEFIIHIQSDKKNNGTDICFILLDEIGQSQIVYKQIADIDYELKQIMASLFKLLI